MPRTPLRQIDPNPRRGGELSPYIRGQIIAYYNKKVKIIDIARELRIPSSTVKSTILQDPKRHNGESKARSGRPNILSSRDQRRILLEIKRDPFLTFSDIRNRTDINLSNTSFKRYLALSKYGHWRAAKRPQLKLEHAKLRLEWAQKYKDWTYSEWSKIIWSDECSVEIGKGKQNLWVFRPHGFGEKWNKEYIIPFKKGKGFSFMIWAAIWGDGHSEINRLSRDEDAPHRGYTARSYLEILEPNLAAIWTQDMTFMQDNAPIHSSHKVKDWLQHHGIEVMEWPPYSPDLNPIENAWARLKERIYKLFPDLSNETQTNEAFKNRFFEAIEAA